MALHVLAGALALVFLASGVQKLVRSREQLAASGLGFAEDFGDASVRTIGVLEVLAAAGLTLPALLELAPVLVPVAATGLTLLMVGAAVVHARRGEGSGIAVALLLAAFAAVVAVARFGPEALTS